MSASNRRRDRIAALEAQIAEMQAAIDRRSIYRPYGCLTRVAVEDMLSNRNFDGFALAYFDMDEMKRHNSEIGKAAVNAIIKRAIAGRSEDVMIGLWFSGDEFVMLAPKDDIFGRCARILARLKERGMSATFIIANEIEGDVFGLIDTLDAETQRIKDTGGRGRIWGYGDDIIF